MIRLSELASKILAETPAEDLAQAIEMPISQFTSKFKQLAADPKVIAVLRAGTTDGAPGDEKITAGVGGPAVSKLRPTQNIIGQEESLNNILDNKYGSLEKFLSGTATFPTPIITYNGKYIVDGHHRWSQVYAANPKAKVPVLDLKGNLEPLELLKVVHLAIAADIGSLPLSDAKGINMLTAGEQTIKDIVVKNLKPEVLDIYKKFGKGQTAQEVADYIWGNVKLMQSKNRPIPGAPDRSAMPQTDEAPGYQDKLEKGIVNYIEPKDSDVKTESRQRWLKIAGILKD